MEIYMAGGVSGNLSGLFKDESMKLMLAREHPVKNGSYALEKNNALFILESFIYAKDNEWLPPLIPRFKSFMLDSGAFTFMSGNGGGQNWDRYVEEYAAFILKHNIELFFELDIDVVVGLNEVERLRVKLEKLVGRQSIPVWHKKRGKEYWLKMVSDYKYVAIGGIVSKEIEKKDFPMFSWFLKTAQQKGCKVHALGFTNLDGLTRYRFYSVDSTAWLYGNRGGFLYQFNNGKMEKIPVKEGMRLKSKEVAIHNFNQWVRFQQYAEANL